MQNTQQTLKTGLIVFPSWSEDKPREYDWILDYPYYRDHDFVFLKYLEKSLKLIKDLNHADIIRCHSATLNEIHDLNICDLYWQEKNSIETEKEYYDAIKDYDKLYFCGVHTNMCVIERGNQIVTKFQQYNHKLIDYAAVINLSHMHPHWHTTNLDNLNMPFVLWHPKDKFETKVFLKR